MATPVDFGDDGDGCPKLPRLSLSAIFALRRRLVDDAYEFYGLTLKGEILLAFAHYIRKSIGLKVGFDAVYESCRTIAGGALDDATLYDFAWRLAANLSLLKAGAPVVPWTGQADLEWVPVEVLAVAPAVNKYRRVVADCVVVSLAGTSAGVRFSKRWTQKEYSLLASVFGYTPPWAKPPMPFHNRDEMTGLRFWALIDPERSSSSRPGFRRVRLNGQLLSHNLRLIKIRARVDPCPRGYTHECYRCAVGRDSCPAATHPLAYYCDACGKCSEPQAVFDPALSKTLCLRCEVRRRLTPG